MADCCESTDLVNVTRKAHQEMMQPQLETLPLELIVQIFSYLDSRCDLISCCKVCKPFYSAAISQSLWKSLCRKVWRINENELDWRACYREMFLIWGRYEQCYASIRQAWDLIESYLSSYCHHVLAGLNNGATEDELNQAEIQNLKGNTLPNDYRCFLRIHNGQRQINRSGLLGFTHIGNHAKREALLSVKTATDALKHMQDGRRGCIPITLCVINTCGHYLAITEEAGHKQGRVFWPSLDEETVNLPGDNRMHCFIIADSFCEWFTSYAESLVTEPYPVRNGEIYPFRYASEHTGDNGITVKAGTCFLPEQSKVKPPRFFFTYRIIISMDESFPKSESCKLHTRHWYITDANGKKEEVHGDAVVGKYPTMIPGAKHEYVSCTRFSTPTGTMEGYYTFTFLYKGGTTNAKIAPMHFQAPRFELASERLNRLSLLPSSEDVESESD